MTGTNTVITVIEVARGAAEVEMVVLSAVSLGNSRLDKKFVVTNVAEGCGWSAIVDA